MNPLLIFNTVKEVAELAKDIFDKEEKKIVYDSHPFEIGEYYKIYDVVEKRKLLAVFEQELLFSDGLIVPRGVYKISIAR